MSRMKMPSLCKSTKQKPISFQNVIVCEFCRMFPFKILFYVNFAGICLLIAPCKPEVTRLSCWSRNWSKLNRSSENRQLGLWLLSGTMSKHQLRNSLKSLWYVLLNGGVNMWFHSIGKDSFKFPFSISESVEVWSSTIVQVIVANCPDDRGRFAEFRLQLSSFCHQEIPCLRHGRFLR